MICVALNGGKEPNLETVYFFLHRRARFRRDLGQRSTLNPAQPRGIVSGVGGGRFSPCWQPGPQLAKMLLVALGYAPDEANFTGNGWDTNVNVIVTQKGLYEGSGEHGCPPLR